MIDLTDIDAKLHHGISSLAADMQAHGYQRDDPAREIFALLGDRWTTLILLVLRIGEWRHAELRRILGRIGAEGKISQRVLTLKLRALERDGMVIRNTSPDIPPKVSYHLTEMGQALVHEAEKLLSWVHAHSSAIDAARNSFGAED